MSDDEEFTSDDFSLLERFSQSTYGNKLFKYLKKNQLFDGEDGKVLKKINRKIFYYYYAELSNKFVLFLERSRVSDDKIMKIISLLVPRPQSRSRYDIPFHGDEHRYINYME